MQNSPGVVVSSAQASAAGSGEKCCRTETSCVRWGESSIKTLSTFVLHGWLYGGTTWSCRWIMPRSRQSLVEWSFREAYSATWPFEYASLVLVSFLTRPKSM